MKIKTGKDLIDSNVVKFEVLNECLIGTLSKQDKQYIVRCKDHNGFFVKKFELKEDSLLNWDIKVLKKNDFVKAYVKVLYNEKETLEPLEDYLDRVSHTYGFDSYILLREAKYMLSIPTSLYDENGNPLPEDEVANVKENIEVLAPKDNSKCNEEAMEHSSECNEEDIEL